MTPVLGHTPESIMNESFFQFIHEAERSEVYAQLSKGQAVETGMVKNEKKVQF